jgi:hypothetical protein
MTTTKKPYRIDRIPHKDGNLVTCYWYWIKSNKTFIDVFLN